MVIENYDVFILSLLCSGHLHIVLGREDGTSVAGHVVGDYHHNGHDYHDDRDYFDDPDYHHDDRDDLDDLDDDDSVNDDNRKMI